MHPSWRLMPMSDTNDSHPAALNLEAATHALCTCGLSQYGAFCDGSHTKLTAARNPRPWWTFWG